MDVGITSGKHVAILGAIPSPSGRAESNRRQMMFVSEFQDISVIPGFAIQKLSEAATTSAPAEPAGTPAQIELFEEPSEQSESEEDVFMREGPLDS